MRCEFCNIIRGQSRAEVLYTNEHAIAILDIRPIHFGHALIIPRVHYETFVEIPEEILHAVITATKVVSRGILGSLNPPGFNIFSNNGKAAGQSVFHFHFHVTPRYPEDNIRFVLSLKQYSAEGMSEYAERIRRQIGSLAHHQQL